MDRRGFMSVVGASILAASSLVEGQRVPEIGVLVFGTKRLSLSAERGVGELREALRGFGWIDGQSIRVTTQFADLKEERLAFLAQEFVRRRVDIIVAIGTPPTDAARRATTSIPIVMSGASDPIAAGFTRSLARPDRNVTGTSLVLTETAGKRLQFLKEVIPRLTRTAVLHAGGRAKNRLPTIFSLSDYVDAGASCLMGRIGAICFDARRPTWTRSSKAPNPLTCPWSNPRSLNWSSI